MTIQHRILSTLATTEEVISPPPMLAMVLETVFKQGGVPKDTKLSNQANPNITTRMLRVADFSSIAAASSDGHTNLDYGAAKSLVLSLSIYNQLVDRGFTEDKQFLIKWQRFLEVANASQYIASLLDPALIEQAYIAGLLHDFGRICLHRVFPVDPAESPRGKGPLRGNHRFSG